jgi:hypothetical protein
MGVHWGIGDGNSMRIPGDNWIPGVSPIMLKPNVPLQDYQLMSSLILEDTRSWDVELVKAIFSEDV